MLKSLRIENFRGFQEFELQNLGRVNLLVGENNSGKTSLLEAIQIFASHGDLKIISDLMKYRGEYFWATDKRKSDRKEYDICHLFYRHKISSDTQFSLIGQNNDNQEKLTISIESPPRQISFDFTEHDNNDLYLEEEGKFDLIINWKGQEQRLVDVDDNIKIPLSINDGLDNDYIRRINRIIASNKMTQTNLIGTFLITPFSLQATEITSLFDNIVLTPDEKLIIETLNIIEPSIERIAAVGQEKYRFSSRRSIEKGGFKIKFVDQKNPVPIGSLGDGIWRILAIILAMVNLENGILLIDEIDTGLHFTTLFDMWKVILATARKLNIQVFATTHNSDCWTSLAKLIQSEEIEPNEITIQRIESHKKQSVAFNEKQIVIAAERGIEVR